MYVCMYVCMYVFMYVCMYICMYLCMYVYMYVIYLFNNVCVCAKKRLFAPNCSLSQSNSGICSSVNGAYVPAITVCRQRLF
jgi:hypothetical protein